LVYAVERGFQAAVGILADVEQQSKFASIRVKRTVPIAGNVLREANGREEKEYEQEE
jgi:hypothetical protein